VKFFKEFNPTRDEWTTQDSTYSKAIGMYGAGGWCLVGLYVIWPDYFAIVIFNRAIGICE
jgi:hypothetical protein